MKEVWKDIKGYEGLYKISNYGRIKSLERIIPTKINNNDFKLKREKILSPSKSKNGYLRICLFKNGNKKTYSIHRLVAQAFIPNPNNLPEVNHKDESKENNRVDNLEWCNNIYNQNYGTRKERISKNKSKKVNQYDLNGIFIKTWNSLTQVEKELGLWQQNITKCCQGKYKTVGGYIWRYYEG